MNARRAARELALLTLFQLEKQEDPKSLEKSSLRDLMLSAIRTLVEQAREQIQSAADSMAQVSRSLIEFEQEHPDNLATPIGVESQPVPIPTTREMVEKIETCLQGAEFVYEALRIPLLSLLSQKEEVQNYAIRLIRLVRQYQKEFDVILNELSEEWRVERLVKMDRYILLMAACEMKYVGDVDVRVAINEAVELAKQFSTPESHRFINGVLGRLAERIGDKKEAAPELEGAPHV